MKIPMTQRGIEELDSELKHLSVTKRHEISAAIGVAREHGDLKENAEYHAAKEEQAQVEARIAYLSDLRSKVMPMSIKDLEGDTVNFGALVTIIDDDTEEESKYCIVSEFEADLELGLISNTSPIGRSLMKKEVGDIVEVDAPRGLKCYEIINIEYNIL